ncbi:MAG TPA: TetR/AcrR family transcriptional regulator C-terminal domain-containing protein [Rubrobacteraceae bacterium]|nr:TetR/AcrR family transcriptional regulator C-terminal domain-containing protein [Rubrobacteraceae bacterium]
MAATKRQPLNRERILEAAIDFVDREGLEALSMRKLGAELGVEAMSLYNHVQSKGALLDGMVEVLLRDLKVPPESDDWEVRVREAYRRFRQLAHAHPNVFPLLIVRPPDTMDGAWLVETFLNTLQAAGFDAKTALQAYRTLTSFTVGYVISELRGFAMEPGNGRLGARGLPSEDFPRLAELSPFLGDIDRNAEFEGGLDLIFSGLRRHLSG